MRVDSGKNLGRPTDPTAMAAEYAAEKAMEKVRRMNYPAATMNRSRRFQVSARYAPLPTKPIAITLMQSSTAKNAKMK